MKNYKVRAIEAFNDLTEEVKRKVGDEFLTSRIRYEFLKDHNVVELVEIIEEKKEEKKEEKPKKRTTKKSVK